jgi:putative membrane protein
MSKLAAAFVTAAALAIATQAPAQEGKKEASRNQASAKKDGKIAGQDMKFMREMAQANLAEVQAGKMAASKASSAEVKKYGQHMVDDHSKALSENRSLAKAKGVQAPSQPAKKHQAAMKKLEKEKGEGFDKAFMQQMVKDHEEALKLHQDAAKNAKDPQLKAAAEKSVPVIQKHLEEAKSIVSSLK